MPILHTDLPEFIAKYAKPYDPPTDTYRRPPFAVPVKGKRSGTTYDVHTYHTKVPPDGIEDYIQHYTDDEDLILDPFCGSGMTGVAALKLGRRVILNDLSPAATHIAYNYCMPVNLSALTRELERISSAVKDEFDWLYGTRCDRCGRPATIQYTIWSDVVECQRCSSEMVLWEVAVDHISGKIRDSFRCTKCHKEHAKRDTRWSSVAPVITNYKCPYCRKQAEHPTTIEEKERIKEIEAAHIPYWYPTPEFDDSWEMWRAVHRTRNISDVSKFYTHRNLWAMSRLWAEATAVTDTRIRRELQFILTSLSQKHATLMTAIILKGGNRPVLTGNQPGTLYVPSFSAEKNLLEVFKRKSKDTTDFIRQIMSQYKGEAVIKTGSAARLAEPPLC